MQTFVPSPFLRRVLAADAALCVASGLALAALPATLEAWLALPAPLLRGAGLFLLAAGALVAWLAARATVPRAAVLALVAVNLLWVAESVAILALGWVRPNALGVALVLAQAAVVAGFAALQWHGLRRPGGATAVAA